jgi:hypothetical protein
MMMRTKVFEIRPRRNAGEGAVGYLMRLADAHGVPLLPEMLIQIGVPWFELAQGKGVEIVGAAAAIDAAALSLDTGMVSRGGVLLRGESLHRRQWSVYASRRACPNCLAEDAAAAVGSHLPRQWHRTWWDVQPVTVCLRHRVELLDHCRRCGEHFDFRATAIGSCPNGHSIADQAGKLVSDMSGDAYLLGRLGAASPIANVLLDEGSLGEVIDALSLIGAAALTGHRFSDIDQLDRHAILHAGFGIFDRWPTAFDFVLNGLLVTSETGPGRWGAARSYGPFHERLHELKPGPIAERVKERVRHHALTNGVAISRRIFGVAQAPTDMCSVRHAAVRLGMGFERARRELKRRGYFPARTRRGTPIAIPSTAVDEILRDRRNRLGVQSLSGLLAIGRTQTRRLIAAGIFGPPEQVPRHAADAFLEKLSKGASPNFAATGTAPLPEACRTARCAIEVAVSGIVSGKLAVSGFRKGRGLAGVFVRVADLRPLGKNSRDAMTIEDAARLLDVKWETMRGLVRLRLIRSGRGGVTAAAVDAFRTHFVAGATLAQRIGVRPRTLMKALSDAGTIPAAAPPRCRQVFYRRTDVVRARGLGSRYQALRAAAGRH